MKAFAILLFALLLFGCPAQSGPPILNKTSPSGGAANTLQTSVQNTNSSNTSAATSTNNSLNYSRPPAVEHPVNYSFSVYYFYGEECPFCARTKPAIDSLEQKYPDVRFVRLETWHNSSNFDLYNRLAIALAVPYRGVPTVFVCGDYVFGAPDIETKLELAIKSWEKNVQLCTDPISRLA